MCSTSPFLPFPLEMVCVGPTGRPLVYAGINGTTQEPFMTLHLRYLTFLPGPVMELLVVRAHQKLWT